jgi:hypothetical protein
VNTSFKRALLTSLTLLPLASTAEEVEHHAVWLASGFATYHFQTDQNLRNENRGIGLEYRYSAHSSMALGRFNNSDWQTTRYLSWQYQHFTWGGAKFGAAIGLFDGYPKVNNSGWFVAAIPALSFEYQRLGANLIAVPTYRDKLHGAVSLQVKFKLL